ncbi:hypothetical protein G4923_01965 [Aeromonas rivipollensis]|uniref:Uncharacterized protein n=1 Tax=Aeromonas rivipollensis TaxID=948519 RepID=A0ABX0CUQ9_9GAMM|nr:hypothetical protein [Aeromonas rivipollensis]NEX87482.1 hypothetical protein [Aeromonas rivipollensis]NEY05302.1 hypothetical protein [Aeromonas rivipollensis]
MTATNLLNSQTLDSSPVNLSPRQNRSPINQSGSLPLFFEGKTGQKRAIQTPLDAQVPSPFLDLDAYIPRENKKLINQTNV